MSASCHSTDFIQQFPRKYQATVHEIAMININKILLLLTITIYGITIYRGKIEKVPRGIRGEKSSKDMASSRNLVSTIGALASPKIGDGTRCPEG